MYQVVLNLLPEDSHAGGWGEKIREDGAEAVVDHLRPAEYLSRENLSQIGEFDEEEDGELGEDIPF